MHTNDVQEVSQLHIIFGMRQGVNVHGDDKNAPFKELTRGCWRARDRVSRVRARTSMIELPSD